MLWSPIARKGRRHERDQSRPKRPLARPVIRRLINVDEDELRLRYGTHPAEEELAELRRLLDEECARGLEADTLLMKLLCVQLFNAGHLEDVLRVWAAKQSSFDAACSVDVQLLCGRGLDATRAHLAALHGEAARQALDYLDECVRSGDFDDFEVVSRAAYYDQYYAAR